MRYYYNEAFRLKMLLTLPAIIFQFILLRLAGAQAEDRTPAWSRLSAVVSLGLWLSVGIAGRAIGFI
jgi:hypothetical protein